MQIPFLRLGICMWLGFIYSFILSLAYSYSYNLFLFLTSRLAPLNHRQLSPIASVFVSFVGRDKVSREI